MCIRFRGQTHKKAELAYKFVSFHAHANTTMTVLNDEITERNCCIWVDMYLNVCSNYPGAAWVMRPPDHLSLAGVREWGMCHILFKQPDAVCWRVGVCVSVSTVHADSSASSCSSCYSTVPPLRLLADLGSFPPDTVTTAGIHVLQGGKKGGQLRRRRKCTFRFLWLGLCLYVRQVPCSLQTILRCGLHLKRAKARHQFQRTCARRPVRLVLVSSLNPILVGLEVL